TRCLMGATRAWSFVILDVPSFWRILRARPIRVVSARRRSRESWWKSGRRRQRPESLVAQARCNLAEWSDVELVLSRGQVRQELFVRLRREDLPVAADSVKTVHDPRTVFAGLLQALDHVGARRLVEERRDVERIGGESRYDGAH